MAERFTPFFEWAAQWSEVTLPEALLLCRFKMWGNDGSRESNRTLARVLKLSVPTVKRGIAALLNKTPPLVTKEYLDKRGEKRVLKFNFQLTTLPLFDSANRGRGDPSLSKDGIKVSPNQGQGDPQPGSPRPPTIQDKKILNSATPAPLPADGQSQALLTADNAKRRAEAHEAGKRFRELLAARRKLNSPGISIFSASSPALGMAKCKPS